MFDLKALFMPLLASVVRHAITSFGAILVTIGVSEAQVSTFQDATTPVVIGVLVWALGQGLSFKDKTKL